MSIYSKYYKQVSKGIEAEEVFKRLAVSKGYIVAEATLSQNKYDKYDFLITKNKRAFMIDVKSIKSDGIIVELKNNFGYDGWGQPDSKVVLAIEQEDSFVLVKVSDLRRFADSKVLDKTVYQSTNPKEYYKLYTRKEKYGYDDLFVVLPPSDLDNIPNTKWLISEDLPN
jgi:hypothetical protein